MPAAAAAVEARRPLTLRDDVRLDVAVVVLAAPDEAAVRLERLRHHVVDQPMLVPDAGLLELRLVLAADTKRHRTLQQPEISVPAGSGKGQGAKEIGHNLARERPKSGHNLLRKRHKIFYGLVGD